MLGEHDQLVAVPGAAGLQDMVLQDIGQLAPLGVVVRGQHPAGHGHQMRQLVDLESQFLDGAGSRGRRGSLLELQFELTLGVLVGLVPLLVELVHGHLAPGRQDVPGTLRMAFDLVEQVLEPGQTSFE